MTGDERKDWPWYVNSKRMYMDTRGVLILMYAVSSSVPFTGRNVLSLDEVGIRFAFGSYQGSSGGGKNDQLTNKERAKNRYEHLGCTCGS